MADQVSLIPAEYRKKGIKLEDVFSKAGGLILVLIVVCLLIYGGLIFYKQSLDERLNELEIQLSELNEQRDEAFEKEVLSLERILSNLKMILRNHFYWSNVFLKLGELTIPQVSLSDFNGNIENDGSITLTLEGSTSGYTYLARQLKSFEQGEFVSKTDLSGITLGTEGSLEFNLNLSLEKDILIK